MKERLKTIIHKNTEILVLDYSDLKESEMIKLITAAKELIARENKKVVVLSILNRKNYISPKFMRTAERQIREVEHLIVKNSITGISEVQGWLVKGINLWHKSRLHVFDSVDNALDFLVA